MVQADHGVYIKKKSDIPKKFADIPNSIIDHRLEAYTAVRGCNSNKAAKLNQANIIKYIIECLVSGRSTKQLENKSYYDLTDGSAEYGKVFRVYQK